MMMRKSNGMLLGTIIVFLIGGVIFLQSQIPAPGSKSSQSAESSHDHDHEEPGEMKAPSLSETKAQIKTPEDATRPIPEITSKEKFKPPVEQPDTLPNQGWYKGSKYYNPTMEQKPKRSGN
jgi:hypothetical protein